MNEETLQVIYIAIRTVMLLTMVISFILMLDKINKYRDKKLHLVIYILLPPILPFHYFNTRKTKKQECSIVPLILFIVAILLNWLTIWIMEK